MGMISENLKKLRLKKNIKQEFLAEELKIALRTYSSYERGETEISAEDLKKIAELLGEPVEIFFSEDVYAYKQPDSSSSSKEDKAGYAKAHTPTKRILVELDLDNASHLKLFNMYLGSQPAITA
jgi:transcriptional regulator with XRE-family HTH domain